MKHFVIVALGGALLLGVTVIPGHAQEVNSMRGGLALTDGLDPNLQLPSPPESSLASFELRNFGQEGTFGAPDRSFGNIPRGDIGEDFREIGSDYRDLIRALRSGNPEAIAAAKAALQFDINDLQGDFRGVVVSEDE